MLVTEMLSTALVNARSGIIVARYNWSLLMCFHDLAGISAMKTTNIY
jgi:hypothetical protein